MAAEVGSELTVMPGGPVLTGGPEELLPASEFTVIFEGEPLDLRLFIGPEDPRPWDLPEFSEEEQIRVMKVHLKMRFEFVEKRARWQSEQSCRQGMEKETWKIMRTAGVSPY